MIHITEDEWKAEIDKFHTEIINRRQTKYVLTKEQAEFVKYCREKNPPISWRNIVVLFKKRGWRGSKSGLKLKWDILNEQ
jgi:hypothetical protein